MMVSLAAVVVALTGCGRSAPSDEVAGAEPGSPVAADQAASTEPGVSTDAQATADTGTGAIVVGNDPAQESTATTASTVAPETTTPAIVPGAGSVVHGPTEAGVRVISDGPIVAPPPAPQPGDTPSTVAGPSQTYVIESGDTLSGIAEKLGVPVDSIAQANNIADVNEIKPGQELIIPAPSPAPATDQ
jgi:LysM repeat protein